MLGDEGSAACSGRETKRRRRIKLEMHDFTRDAVYDGKATKSKTKVLRE